MLLLLPLLRFLVVYGVAFVAAASYSLAAVFAAFLLLLRVLFRSPTVEKPTLAAFDLPKCQKQFYN